MYKKIVLVLFSVSVSLVMCAQRISISTDMLKLATLSPSIGFDIALSSHITLNVEGVFSPFGNILEEYSVKRITVSPEVRYWFKRPLYSHYLGIGIIGSIHDIKFNNNRYKGQAIALGLGYGYGIIINERICLTPSIGFGYGYVFSYTNPEQNEQSPLKGSFKPMVTRLGISLSYIIN